MADDPVFEKAPESEEAIRTPDTGEENPNPNTVVVEGLAATEEDLQLTRSEIINEFGEELGRKLIEGGFSTITSLLVVEIADEELQGIGLIPEEIAKVREFEAMELANAEDKEESGDELEEETAAEEEVDEADSDSAESDASEEGEAGEVAEEEATEAPESDGGPEEPAVEEAGGEVATMDVHVHEVPAPMTYSEARAKLEDMSYAEIKEIIEDGDEKAPRSKAESVAFLLAQMFPPEPVAPAEEGEVEMSVRVKRIKGLL